MAKAKAYYGKKVRTDAYDCRFVKLYEKDDKGKYSVELLVPTKEAVKLNRELYDGKKDLINFMKPTKRSKMPKPLFSDVYVWDEENECVLMDLDEETGEEFKVVNPDLKVFRFKTGFLPKIQMKKGLDKTARVGWGSKLSISTNIYASTTKDEAGNTVKYATLNLNAVRVYDLVTVEREADWADGDDEFEDSEVVIREEKEDKPEEEYEDASTTDDSQGDDWEDAEEVAPKKPKKKTANKSSKSF